MPIYFYNPHALLWLWIVPCLVGLFVYAGIKRRAALRAFGAKANAISRKREAVGSSVSVALLILALARPAWDVEEQQINQAGRNVVFLLDVSRSMLAEDLFPNRLESAKISIRDCIETLSGDRIGLVVFAGSAEVRCPLTVDYGYFRMTLDQVSPESVSLGGTMIANAIDKTVAKLLKEEKAGLQDIILITDGEDLVEGFDEVEAARKLTDVGARLIIVGIGDQQRGSRISQVDKETESVSFMQYKDREVWTRLHSETLRQMAAVVPNSAYFDVADGTFNLAQIYEQVMHNSARVSMDKQVVERYKEKFHLFIGAAVIVLLGATRWRRKS